MADISIVKIKIRRGNNADRIKVVLDSGELGYTVDTKRLFVGDGNTFGGISISTNFLGVGPLSAGGFGDALPLDTVFDSNTKKLYALTGSNGGDIDEWYDISPRVDESTIRYDSNYKLGVIPGSINSLYMNIDSLVGLGLENTLPGNPGGVINVKYDGITIKLNPFNTLYVDPNTIRIMDLTQAAGSLDCQNLKMENLPFFEGLSATVDDPANPAFQALPTKSIYVVREPPLIGFNYVCIKY